MSMKWWQLTLIAVCTFVSVSALHYYYHEDDLMRIHDMIICPTEQGSLWERM